KNLKGHLMLITGDIDNNVHPSNTYRLADALIKANKRFDMMVLPGQRHGYTTDGEYVTWLRADYFAKHLLATSIRASICGRSIAKSSRRTKCSRAAQRVAVGRRRSRTAGAAAAAASSVEYCRPPGLQARAKPAILVLCSQSVDQEVYTTTSASSSRS